MKDVRMQGAPVPALLLCSGVLLFLAGCLAGCRPAEQTPIRVGVLADLETPGGPATVNAARMAVQAVNDSGGVKVDGRRHTVELFVEDTRNTPQGAVEATKKLINQAGVVVLVGPNISRNAIPVAEVAENLGIPMITPGSSNPRTTAGKRYVFRATFTDPVQGRVMAHFARADLSASTAALLYDEANPYSRDIAGVFGAVFEAEGGRVVAEERYTTGASDFRSSLARIAATGASVLFLPNGSREAGLQAVQARAAGVTAVLLGSDLWSPTLLAGVRALDGAYFSHGWHPDMAASNPRARAFVEAYEQVFGAQGYVMAAQTYDAFGLLWQALGSAGNTGPEAIRAGLAAIHEFEGVTGSFRFEGTGDPVKSLAISKISGDSVVLYQVVHPQ